MTYLKLNLGSGPDIRDDYINIDFNNCHHPDMMWDLNTGIPFNDGCVDEIIAWNVLEHLAPEVFESFVKELYRVCCPKGIIDIRVPIGKGWQRWPEHRIPFDEGSEEYFGIFNIEGKQIFKIKDKEIFRTDDGAGDELRFKLIVQK